MPEREIDKLRAQIDFIDKQIVHLLNERTKLVLKIKGLKEERKISLYDPKREEEILSNAVRNNEGPLFDDTVRELFERIIHSIRLLEGDSD